MGGGREVSGGRSVGSRALPKNFLHPSLLLLLKEQPGYGYDLVARLKKLGVDDDPATVYRALRTLEESHAASSHWNTSSAGPARRVYRLTPSGEDQLRAAFAAAVDTNLAIQRYFSRYAAAAPSAFGDQGQGGVDVVADRRDFLEVGDLEESPEG